MHPIRVYFIFDLLIRHLFPLVLLLVVAPLALAAHPDPGCAEARAGARLTLDYYREHREHYLP